MTAHQWPWLHHAWEVEFGSPPGREVLDAIGCLFQVVPYGPVRMLLLHCMSHLLCLLALHLPQPWATKVSFSGVMVGGQEGWS